MMEVILYTTNKQKVMSYDLNNIQQIQYLGLDNILRIRNDSHVLDKQEVKVNNIPIHRFCWADYNGVYKEVYAAFDNELLELIGCHQEKFKQDVEQAADRLLKPIETELLSKKTELETLQRMNVWATIKWKFKQIWGKK